MYHVKRSCYNILSSKFWKDPKTVQFSPRPVTVLWGKQGNRTQYEQTMSTHNFFKINLYTNKYYVCTRVGSPKQRKIG